MKFYTRLFLGSCLPTGQFTHSTIDSGNIPQSVPAVSGCNNRTVEFLLQKNTAATQALKENNTIMKTGFPLLIVLLLFTNESFSQAQLPWKGKKAAVVLTYDDAIDQHLDNAIPLLDSLRLRATFYVTAFSTSMQERMADWRLLAKHGHELGNHTLYHPCTGGAGREWVKKEYDLNHYTVKRMEEEIRMTNLFLHTLDGKTKRTFAYTCGDMKVEDSTFMNGLKKDFIAARAVRNEMHQPKEIDLYNVDCYMVNNHSFEEMKSWVDKAIQTRSLLVFLFHGVGGGNGLDVSLPAHRQILTYIKQNQKDIYVAPMIEVAEHLKIWQGK